MCKHPIKYEETVIYKICSTDPAVSQIYIGSTTNLKARRGKHKSACNNPKGKQYDEPKYAFIRANGGWESWRVVLVEEWPCSNYEEQRQRERHWFDAHTDKLNTYRPYTSPGEKTAQSREYRDTHKDKSKAYYEENKDRCKDAARAYREETKDAMRYYQAAYREIKKVEINKKQNEKNQAKKAATHN